MPGTGKNGPFRYGGKSHGRRMQPYMRPRKGGGKSKRNADW